MKVKSFLIAVSFILVLSVNGAELIPTFADIIKKNGTAAISDGSSLFTFSADGTFSQEPVEESGRTVGGKWSVDQPGARFTIFGEWSWMNGSSPSSDRRRMEMVIYPYDREPKFKTINHHGTPLKVYRVYFEIEELVKTPASGIVSPTSH